MLVVILLLLSRTVTWIADHIPPVSLLHGAVTTLGCNPSASDINAALGTATATDACGTATVTSSDGLYQQHHAVLRRQEHLLLSMLVVILLLLQEPLHGPATNPPTIIITGAVATLGCNPSASDINAALGTATATAACGTPTVTVTDGPVQSNGCSVRKQEHSLLQMVVVIRATASGLLHGPLILRATNIHWQLVLHESLGCNPSAC